MAGNADQVAYWNEQAGPTWAELQPLLDAQIAPLGLRGLQALAPAAGERILDIGCGCGDTTLAIAQRVAPGGEVMGLDLSAPMLDVARRRAAAIAGISFLQADAQTVQFPVPFEASFSRFGVMFFEDAVAAFTNIHAALVPGGRLVFVCWRHALENAWMMVPLNAASHFLPPLEPMDPDAPGPFSLAAADRVRAVLQQSGFRNVQTEAFDTPIGGFALDQAVTLALRVGPLGKLLREWPDAAQDATGAVRGALAQHETPSGVYLNASVWIVSATA
jgi:SAM-dependent methyltransferase